MASICKRQRRGPQRAHEEVSAVLGACRDARIAWASPETKSITDINAATSVELAHESTTIITLKNASTRQTKRKPPDSPTEGAGSRVMRRTIGRAPRIYVYIEEIGSRIPKVVPEVVRTPQNGSNWLYSPAGGARRPTNDAETRRYVRHAVVRAEH